MNEDVTPLMKKLENTLSQLSAKLEEAKSSAREALTQADYAADNVKEARSYADNADDYIIEAQQHYDTVVETIAALRAKLEDPDRLESTGLSVKMTANKARVMKAHRAGHDVKRIANSFNLSEFLVNQIITSSA